MGYIAGLLILVSVIFSVAAKSDILSGNVLDKIKTSATSLIPKSENEIMVDNLNSNFKTLDSFFKNSANNVLQSKNISDSDKAALQNAINAYNSTSGELPKIESKIKDDKNLIQKLTEKVLKLDKEDNPEPTSIPPNCRLTCDEK